MATLILLHQLEVFEVRGCVHNLIKA